jgi:putative membrane protein
VPAERDRGAPPTGGRDDRRDEGIDPDVRFSYANERTFLAWNRTALALVTAGLAVTQLLPPFDVPGGRRMIGLPLIALGTLLSVASFGQWQRNERAMRLGLPLPRSILPALVSAVVAVSAVIALVLAIGADRGGSG